MKLDTRILAVLSASVLAVSAHGEHPYARHAHMARQAPPPSKPTQSSSSSAPSPPSGATPAPGAPPPAGGAGVPPLSQLTSGMPTGTSLPLAATFTPGAVPSYSGAPPLPSHCTFVSIFRSRGLGSWRAQISLTRSLFSLFSLNYRSHIRPRPMARHGRRRAHELHAGRAMAHGARGRRHPRHRAHRRRRLRGVPFCCCERGDERVVDVWWVYEGHGYRGVSG